MFLHAFMKSAVLSMFA